MKHWRIPETGHFYKANLHPDQEEAYQGCPRRDGGVIPCKTDKAIPRELLFEAMAVINRLCVPQTVHIGDVLLENILDTGANVVATAERVALIS